MWKKQFKKKQQAAVEVLQKSKVQKIKKFYVQMGVMKCSVVVKSTTQYNIV